VRHQLTHGPSDWPCSGITTYPQCYRLKKGHRDIELLRSPGSKKTRRESLLNRVGCILLFVRDRLSIFCAVIVDEKERGKGYGKMLMSAVESFAARFEPHTRSSVPVVDTLAAKVSRVLICAQKIRFRSTAH